MSDNVNIELKYNSGCCPGRETSGDSILSGSACEIFAIAEVSNEQGPTSGWLFGVDVLFFRVYARGGDREKVVCCVFFRFFSFMRFESRRLQSTYGSLATCLARSTPSVILFVKTEF